MNRLWKAIPEAIRAIIVGYLAAGAGSLGDLFIFGNLRFFPTIPWMLPATTVWLCVFYRYATGHWWPQATRESRHEAARSRPLSRSVWLWAIVAGSFGLISVLGVGFLTPRLSEIPPDAFNIPIRFSDYPWWTVVSILLVISAIAGVAEEIGYRGYMLSGIQRRHGWVVATIITGSIFFLDHHLSHAYATFAFLPFFLAVSTVHALLVYFTRSIRPSMVLHAVFDFLVIPVQYGLVGAIPRSSVFKTGIDASFVMEIAIVVAFGLAAIPAFQKLQKVSG